MKGALHDLVETIAARGALVVAPDGMLIAAEVREGVDVERLAALGASILTDIGLRLQRAGLQPFTHLEIAAEQGKLILLEAGPTFLLVLLGPRLELGPSSIEIRSAALRIARLATLATN